MVRGGENTICGNWNVLADWNSISDIQNTTRIDLCTCANQNVANPSCCFELYERVNTDVWAYKIFEPLDELSKSARLETYAVGWISIIIEFSLLYSIRFRNPPGATVIKSLFWMDSSISNWGWNFIQRFLEAIKGIVRDRSKGLFISGWGLQRIESGIAYGS